MASDRGEIDRPALRIGTSGAPASTPRSGTVHAVRQCAALNIRALEVGWVHRVNIGRAAADDIRQEAENLDIRLSVHAPYYVNLNSRDREKRGASIERLVASAEAAAWIGAGSAVLHLGYHHGDPTHEVRATMRRGLDEVRARADERGAHAVVLRPEVMGRVSQFGDLDEVLRLCQTLPRVEPCIDIAHLHARTGAWNSRGEFEELWRRHREALGRESVNCAHIHISGIDYGPQGERRHLSFAESDLDVIAFLEVLCDEGVGGTMVTESPRQEEDTLWLVEAWRSVRAGAPCYDSLR